MSNRDIVVIGASAGGVAPLRQLVAGLPSDFPAAVFVVLHIGPYPSMLPALLAAASPNVVTHAEHGAPITPGRILVAPPDHHLMLERDTVSLTRGAKEHHTRPAIDPLFRSAALMHGPRVIGVVLSGGLDDGTAGLQAIKQCNGLAIVQDPREAEDPSMPTSALQNVDVDHCLPIDGIARTLVSLVAEPVPAPAAVPAQLTREHAASAKEGNAMEELEAIGKRSTFVCPDCQGTLWEIDDTEPPRFRCHTGHGFSMRSLENAMTEATEAALWSAVRVLQDRATLLRRVAKVTRAVGKEPEAMAAEAEADVAEADAQALKRIAEKSPQPANLRRAPAP